MLLQVLSLICKVTALVTALLTFGIGGCGYRFTAAGAPLPENIRSVSAPIMANRTGEPAFEVVVTQALRDQLVRAGVLGARNTEAEIIGEIVNIYAGPLLSGAYRASLVVDLKLIKNGRTISATRVSGNEDYPVSSRPGDILELEGNRQAALKRLAESTMREGYDRLSTGW